MKALLSLLRGIDIPPVAVGFARGAAEVAVMAAIIALGTYVSTEIDLNNTVLGAGVFWWSVRTAEGLADHIDPAKKRAPSSSGSSPAPPAPAP